MKRSWAPYAGFAVLVLAAAVFAARRTFLEPIADRYTRQALEARLSGDAAVAKKRLERALSLVPDHPAALILRGFDRIEQGDFDGAIADADAVLKSGTYVPDANRLRCAGFAKKMDYVNAVASCEKAASMLETPAQVAEALTGLCRAQFAHMEFRKAIEACDAALKADPTFVGAMAQRGIARVAVGPKEAAIEDLTRVVQTEPRLAAEYGPVLETIKSPAWAPVVPTTLGYARSGLISLGRIEFLHYAKTRRWGTLEELRTMPESARYLAPVPGGGDALAAAMKGVFKDGAADVRIDGDKLAITATAKDPKATSMTLSGGPDKLVLPEMAWAMGTFDELSVEPEKKPSRRRR